MSRIKRVIFYDANCTSYVRRKARGGGIQQSVCESQDRTEKMLYMNLVLEPKRIAISFQLRGSRQLQFIKVLGIITSLG
jgi:hypothetical protein